MIILAFPVLNHHVEVASAKIATRAIVTRRYGEHFDTAIGIGGETSTESIRSVPVLAIGVSMPEVNLHIR